MHKVIWTDYATDNLESALAYIAVDDPAAASRIGKKIRTAIDWVAYFPFLGRETASLLIRHLVIPKTNFVLAYKVGEDSIRILALFHTSQEFPQIGSAI